MVPDGPFMAETDTPWKQMHTKADPIRICLKFMTPPDTVFFSGADHPDAGGRASRKDARSSEKSIGCHLNTPFLNYNLESLWLSHGFL